MQATRQRIMEILRERNTATVDELGTALKLTSVTVRHHLDILRSEGLVQAPQVKRRESPGRPQHVYALTETADEHFPKNYAGFSKLMLHEVRGRVEPKELDSILAGMAQRLSEQVPSPQPSDTMPQRLDRLIKFLNAKGYLARWRRGEGGFVLQALNCPYHALLHEHPEPCVMDMSMISRILGQTPERVESMADGSHLCTYLVKDKKTEAAASH